MQPAIRITLAASSPDPTFSGGPFVSGVAQCSTGAAATGWTRDYIVEMGSVGERVDIATGGNYAQLLDTEIILSNHDGWQGLLDDAGGSIIGALVEVGSISGTALSARWSGTVADALQDGAGVTLRVESILAKRHREIPARVVTSVEFPGLATGDDGIPVPIIYGAVQDMEPASIRSPESTLTALVVFDSIGSIERASTFEPSGTGYPSTVNKVCFASFVVADGAPYSITGHNTVFDALQSGLTAFVEVTAGTGSGQRRRLVVNPGPFPFEGGYLTPGNGFTVYWYRFLVSNPWDTIPDTSSTFRFVADEVTVSLAVADEATVSSVVAIVNNGEYNIGHTESTTSGIVFANVSGEFRSGEDYAAIEYVKPSNVYGVPEMSDLVTATTAHTVTGITSGYIVSGGSGVVFDLYCRGKINYDEIGTQAISDDADIYILASVDASSLPSDSDLAGSVKAFPQAIVRKFDGTLHYPQIWAAWDNPGSSSVGFSSFNAFPPAIAPDGSAGQFQSYAWQVPALPFPLSEVASIEWGVSFSAQPLGSAGNHTAIIQATVTAGSDDITVTTGTPPVVGQWVRPMAEGDATFYNASFAVSGYQSGFWQQVTGVAGSVVTVGDASAWPLGDYRFAVVSNADVGTVYERETGIGFVYGTISADTPFRVDTSAGRKFGAHWPALPAGKSNGDPITLARDAVLDMYYRDLGLAAAQVDFAAFQALPDDPITSVLSKRIDSAQRVADLCQQFNWIISHDASGRETATAWLARTMSAADYDYTIDTSDMVEGSITGRDMTDIQDLVNQPRFEWDYTQADGFRQTSNVVDVSADPSTLTSGNYLATLSGFGDFAYSSEIYRALHASFQVNDYRRSTTFRFPDVGSDVSALLWPISGLNRLDWMASRKPVLRFAMPESVAIGMPVVGKRAKVRHKRYTRNAWVYGTVVESAWEPSSEDAQFAVSVMLDPGYLIDLETGLFVDVLDGTTEQYIDVLDGITEQYIDTLGVA